MNEHIAEDRDVPHPLGNGTIALRTDCGERSATGERFAQWPRARSAVKRTSQYIHQCEWLDKVLEQLVIERLHLQDYDLVEHRVWPWASLNFSGTRHEIELRPSRDRATCDVHLTAKAVAEQDFTLPGHILADLAFETSSTTLTLFALAVESG